MGNWCQIKDLESLYRCVEKKRLQPTGNATLPEFVHPKVIPKKFGLIKVKSLLATFHNFAKRTA